MSAVVAGRLVTPAIGDALVAASSRVDPVAATTFAAVFAGSLVAGLAGLAFSAVAGELLLHWAAPTTAVPLLLACSATTQLFSIARPWRSMQWHRAAPFLAGGLVGIPLGAKLLHGLDPHVFSAVFRGEGRRRRGARRAGRSLRGRNRMTWMRATLHILSVWRRRRGQRQAMAYLGDRELRDIGIDRLGSVLEARKPFWKP